MADNINSIEMEINNMRAEIVDLQLQNNACIKETRSEIIDYGGVEEENTCTYRLTHFTHVE